MRVSAGTSGFSYKEWHGSFYPEKLPASRMLEFYAEHLPTVELNNTFYRMPADALMRGWESKSPESFRFVLKAPRTLVRRARPVRPQVFDVQGNAHAQALVTALSGALRGGPADWEGLEHVATSLLGTLLGGERSDTGDLAAAHAYIAAHLADQDLSASRIAAAAGYSERHLSRLFARSGQSVPQAVLTARLDAARRLLTEPISLAEVAARSGFASQAHFSRTYRARFGTTPCKDRRG